MSASGRKLTYFQTTRQFSVCPFFTQKLESPSQPSKMRFEFPRRHLQDDVDEPDHLRYLTKKVI
jgi:hypothetical protein